ncbi:MAG: dihydropteroate synthase [Syntrophobacteraceae bacterium]|nr:dihydropteroate synthase [Syntrophobacteraceae bacterium]
MAVHPRNRFSLRLRDPKAPLELGARTLVMGIVNTTPDSFSDGGRFFGSDSAIEQARRMIDGGADILDIGGESTRPFSEPVGTEEELRRVIPVIEGIRKFSEIPVSIDTTKAAVARRALDSGADMVNDVSALALDEEMVDLVARTGVPLILMHMQGTPRTMQENPHYDSLFSEIISFLEERTQFAVKHGVDRSQVVVDPGIGFGKTVSHNACIVARLDFLHALDRPILFGASRKKFIGAILDREVDDREVGTAVVNTQAILAGAHIIRVHDVPFHRQVAVMADALRHHS